MTSFDIGDLVFVGNPAPLDRKTTWRIVRFDGGIATLSSGQTERLRAEPISNLSHFRLAEPA